MNRACLVGRLTKSPELRYTPNGKATCDFTLAVDRKFKNAQGEKETDFLNCKVPPYKDKLAELCANYLSKGKLAAIEGQIQVRTYTDNDGKKHWVTEIIAEDVTFLSPKDEGSQPPTQPPAQNTAPPYGAPLQYGQPPAQSYPPPGAPQYPGQFAPPGYTGQPPAQGYGQPPQGYMPPPPGYQGAPPQAPPQGYGQPPGQHPNMPNPNFPQPTQQQQSPQTLPPGAVDVNQLGRQVSLDDDIPF